MKLVIDANIVFAALIKKGITAEIVLRDELQLFAPEFLFEEVRKYKELILEKTHRSDNEFDQFIAILTDYIIIIPKEEITPLLKDAEKIYPDPNDVIYLALALALNSDIWSNDKKLQLEHDVIKVISTSELLKIFRDIQQEKLICLEMSKVM